jgi:hypothetical protein
VLLEDEPLGEEGLPLLAMGDRTHDGKERYRGVVKKEVEEGRWKWGSWAERELAVEVDVLVDLVLVDGICLELVEVWPWVLMIDFDDVISTVSEMCRAKAEEDERADVVGG